MSAMVRSRRFFTLLVLRMSLVHSRLLCVAWWQLGLFLTFLLGNLTVAIFALPLAIGVFKDLDGGLLFGFLSIYVAAFSVLNVHLLVARTADGDRRNTIIDPMELLPVPVEWNFYLTIIEEIFADPIALLGIPAALLGVSLSCSNSYETVFAAFLICPWFMALLAGLRLTAGRAASVFLAPKDCNRFVRLIVFMTLLVTVIFAGCFIYDATVVFGQSQGLEPLDIYSSKVIYSLISITKDHQDTLQFLPLMWPVLALMRSSQWLLFTLLTIGTIVSLLVFMAYLHRRTLRRPGRDDGEIQNEQQSDWLLSLPGKLFPCARSEVVSLETDGAFKRGFYSQAIAEGLLLAGAWLLISYIAPQIFAGNFVNGLRFFCFMATLLLLTPAATIARESGGVGLIRIMPLPLNELLFAKVPVVVLRNIIVLSPGALVVAAMSPPASAMNVLGAATLLGLLPFIAAMAAVGGGMVVNPLNEGQGTFALQIVALLLTVLALAPLTIAAPALPSFYLVCGSLVAAFLFMAGLWHKSLERLKKLSLPWVKAQEISFGDVTLAVLIFASAANAVPQAMTLLLPALSVDHTAVLSTALLHCFVIVGTLLLIGSKWRELDGLKRRYLLFAVVLGVLFAIVAIYYGYWVSSWSKAEASSAGLVRIFKEGSGFWPFFAFITAVIIAPSAEELLFRRLLCVSLSKATGKKVTAIFLSSLAFALAHSAPTFPIVFLVGLLSGAMMMKTNVVLVPILFHITFNGSQLLYLLSLGGGQ